MNYREKTFKKRAAEIADHAHNPRGTVGESADFLRGLDETERMRELSTIRIMFSIENDRS